MCSFVVFSSDNLSLSDFSKALKKVYHRGPDNNYLAIENGLLWGFNRLSIMDLSSNGNQPFKYDSCELVCNGEIYNYNSFKKLLMHYEKTLTSEVLFEGRVITLTKDTALLENGKIGRAHV